MKLTQRLGDGARALARIGTQGPEAAYARVLDGEHLWVSTRAGDGRPALLDPQTGTLTEAPPVPDGDRAYASGRWRLDDVLPLAEGAELHVVALDGGRTTRLRPGPPALESSLRVPATPDGQWSFQVGPDDSGLLRVIRTRAPRLARLMDIGVEADHAVRLVLSPPEPDLEPRLHFVSKDEVVVHSVDAEVVGETLVVTLTAADLPSRGGGYRIAIGPADEAVSVARRCNDLLVSEPSNVLLPHLLDGDTEALAARFNYGLQGLLRLQRREGSEDAS